MKKNKIVSIFMIIFMIMATMIGCGKQDEVVKVGIDQTKETKYKDGSYTGKSEGKGGDIVVNVTIANGDIDNVEVVEHHETELISDTAISKIVEAVGKNKSVNVDTISGATMTSTGIIEAIKDALIKAGGTKELFAKDKKITFEQGEEDLKQEYDVVVIGAGGAGLSAAVEAQTAGSRVVVLEKMSSVGGNTLVSGGGLNVPGSDQQKANNIEDSVELFIQDTLKGGDNINKEELVRVLAENALPTAKWLIDDIGVEFMPDRLQQFGGHSVPRALIAKGNHGTDLIKKLKDRADKLGVVFKLETKAEELITDENNKVIGVKAVNNAGQELVFNANKGVVIATGGFGANLEMRTKYNPELDERYKTTDVPGTTGDGIVMAEKLGAELMHMEYIQTYPLCNPKTGIISYVANSRFDGAILINQEGSRFVEEMDRRDVVSKAILSQTNGVGYLVWGQEIEQIGNMTQIHEEEYQSLEKDSFIHKADTIQELAEFFDIDVDTMLSTIKTYNNYVEAGKDEEFNRRGTLRSIQEGPFYIQQVVPSVHHTMGGLTIDTEAHVLDKNGEIIDGLFAAGEVCGGIHGTNRLGGNAVTDVVVYGRIAGKNVAK